MLERRLEKASKHTPCTDEITKTRQKCGHQRLLEVQHVHLKGKDLANVGMKTGENAQAYTMY